MAKNPFSADNQGMKKGFIFIGLLLAFNLSVFAQNTAQEESLQTISWEEAENVRGYEVQIEHLDSQGNWEPFFSQITTQPYVEVLFTPGRYRISVDPVNYLGKTIKQEQWLRFRILTEAEWEEWHKKNSQTEKQPVFEEDEEKQEKSRIWFKAITVSADVPFGQEYNFEMNFRLGADIIDVDWFYWNAGIKVTPKIIGTILNNTWGVCAAGETSVNFRVPLKYVSPHAGILAGFNFVNENGFTFESENFYGAIEAGALIGKYFDLKLYTGFSDLIHAKGFFVSAGIGGRIPLK